MPNPAYLVTSLLNVGVAFSSPTIDPIYGYEYLYDRKQNIPMRWQNNTTQFVDMNFGAPVTADVIAAINQNWSDDAVIYVAAGATAGLGGLIETIPWAEKNAHLQFGSAAFQYWRLGVSDPTNPDQIQLGELVIGQAQVFSRGLSFDAVKGQDWLNTSRVTERGNVSAYEGYNQRTYSMPAGNITPTVEEEIEAMHQAVKGNLTPFFFIPNQTGMPPIWCRASSRYQARVTAKAPPGLIWQSGIELREEADGASVT